MTHTNRSRQPAGTPTGGQFAQETKAPSTLALQPSEPPPDPPDLRAMLATRDELNSEVVSRALVHVMPHLEGKVSVQARSTLTLTGDSARLSTVYTPKFEQDVSANDRVVAAMMIEKLGEMANERPTPHTSRS
ncbi:hypothetical protein GCG21_09000 [Pseudactinotalea sp. HY160]|uniref:hypothetical protein n=1 Tax=Pseudactinotalea sp. HY160 TaxID=2654490 RepID=UPI00128CE810|nr:hypothetical protein [Pseudactinotalea sp. HY160]MPV50140.1 hypothetical protein [Pseudactinotalea sp. HY160]